MANGEVPRPLLGSQQVPRNTNNTTDKEISPLDLQLHQTTKHSTASPSTPTLLPSRPTLYNLNHQKDLEKFTCFKTVANHGVPHRLQARAETVQRLPSFVRNRRCQTDSLKELMAVSSTSQISKSEKTQPLQRRKPPTARRRPRPHRRLRPPAAIPHP